MKTMDEMRSMHEMDGKGIGDSYGNQTKNLNRR